MIRALLLDLRRWWRLRRRVQIRVGDRVELVSVWRAARLTEARLAEAHKWSCGDERAVAEAHEVRQQRLRAKQAEAERRAIRGAEFEGWWR